MQDEWQRKWIILSLRSYPYERKNVDKGLSVKTSSTTKKMFYNESIQLLNIVLPMNGAIATTADKSTKPRPHKRNTNTGHFNLRFI